MFVISYYWSAVLWSSRTFVSSGTPIFISGSRSSLNPCVGNIFPILKVPIFTPTLQLHQKHLAKHVCRHIGVFRHSLCRLLRLLSSCLILEQAAWMLRAAGSYCTRIPGPSSVSLMGISRACKRSGSGIVSDMLFHIRTRVVVWLESAFLAMTGGTEAIPPLVVDEFRIG